MKKPRYHAEFELQPLDNARLAQLCGSMDENLRQIERYFGVEINNRGHAFQIIGHKRAVDQTTTLIKTLYQQTLLGYEIDKARVQIALQQIDGEGQPKELPEDYHDLLIRTRQLKIRPRSYNQYHYLKNMLTHDINFGVGPSGTGKTWLAVACAVAALEAEKIQRIVLVRPAVEAGERLGFLPGNLAEKVDPYLRPLYDALYEMLGVEYVDRLIEKNVIEVAPLAYMRGRTLNDAFIILDESQNTTREQMKMFLTRIGFSSKAVITGDITQIDLPKHETSGLRHAITVLSDIQAIHFTFFQSHDVVRHPLVQLIVEAYEQAGA